MRRIAKISLSAAALILIIPHIANANEGITLTSALETLETSPEKTFDDLLWIMIAAFLVFFMQAGFALVETGFTRAKNVANIMMKNL
jgi:Amt family ammonium transporter